MTDKLIHKHYFKFGEGHSNGGEELGLETRFYSNGNKEDGCYQNQTLTLMSYCNSASFNLDGTLLCPKELRKLADEIEAAQLKAKELDEAYIDAKNAKKENILSKLSSEEKKIIGLKVS